jgi:hypothetical protein
MRRVAGAVLLLSLAAPLAAQRVVVPTTGMVITESVVLRPGRYRLPARDSTPVITIRGDSLTVEMQGVILEGSDPHADPDRSAGTAIRIEGGRAVTVRGATVRGYKVAIHAQGTRDLVLEGHDLSYNWKPRLHSVVELESLADWLSFHHNEQDEWLRLGAAIYLADVEGAKVRGNVARQGMNGLLLVRSSRVEVWNNDFSFLSGLGIGLYRASHNRILHNRVDWCVRGYSHGFYRRGQDSAALLLYEQSSHNVVAYNSMTHGGDGLFLWAGQSTMDTGLGGSNDNLFLGNDFSHAPTNGMEATFSRNRFIGNRVWESTHGLWGGYSYASLIVGNDFRDNRIAIAVEHGQDNRVLANDFQGDSTAIRLWWNPIEPSDWGYPKYRDTRSRDWEVAGNRFRGNRVALRADATTGLVLRGNRFEEVDTIRVQRGDSAGLAVDTAGWGSARGEAQAIVRQAWSEAPPLPDGIDPMLPDTARRGRETIIVDEWGPYDWRSPKLWPVARRDERPLRLRVLGPEGAWRVVARRGVARLSATRGHVGDTLVVTPSKGAEHDWAVTLEYRGGRTVSPRGEVREAGERVRFGYTRFEPLQDWRLRVVAWDSTSDPRSDSTAFRARLEGPALATPPAGPLEWMWYRPTIPGIPAERWAAVAETEVTLPRGTHRLRAISDDGVRVWVDGRLVIDRWAPHESVVDEAPIAGGRRRLRVEFYQVDGWTELQLRVERGE